MPLVNRPCGNWLSVTTTVVSAHSSRMATHSSDVAAQGATKAAIPSARGGWPEEYTGVDALGPVASRAAIADLILAPAAALLGWCQNARGREPRWSRV
jgi:hypothetical protein